MKPDSTNNQRHAPLPESPYRRTPFQRRLHLLGHRVSAKLAGWIGPVAIRGIEATIDRVGSRSHALAARIPHVPTRSIRRLRSPARPWTDPVPPPAPELQTVAGVRRDLRAEQHAFEQEPLHDFFRFHRRELIALAPVSTVIATEMSVAPRVMRAHHQLEQRQDIAPTVAPQSTDPADLTEQLKAYAAELGISATGVTAFEEKYTFAEYKGNAVGQTVVVCALEQNYDATQRIPAHRSEQAALATHGEIEVRIVALAEWLRARGWRARPENVMGESLFIAYAVAAGLGQLGLNGQLLTPHAGSRCRLIVLTTNAPLLHDHPRDYGIEGVCDRCQICVRRCPVGAIPQTRKSHRGVTKAKLNSKRCMPMMMQSSGCSLCMKVCPIQRYGLPAVLRHYDSTGEILGKGTDDLEGYDWPLDGQHYGPGATPRVPEEVINPPGLDFGRAAPPTRPSPNPE